MIKNELKEFIRKESIYLVSVDVELDSSDTKSPFSLVEINDRTEGEKLTCGIIESTFK
jgi:hypothetical protein